MTIVSQINAAERKGNPFLRSSTGGRILSALIALEA